MTIEFIFLCVGAYLLGSVPFAFLLAKWFYGIDIRQHGTGKIGAANVLRVVSKWLAIPVAIFDIGKGALMVWASQLVDMGAAAQVTVGIITIVGHNWPVFIGFRGGRGESTTIGALLALITQPMLILAGPAVLTLFIKKNVTIASCVLFTSLLLVYWALGVPGSLIGYSMALPCLVGFTHFLRTRQAVNTLGT